MGLMLDIAIGMCGVFLLASLFVTVLQELIAQALALRARYLTAGIINLVHSTQQKVGLLGATFDRRAWNDLQVRAFYDHPMIAALNSSRLLRTGAPSYISKDTFVDVVMDMAKAAFNPAPPPAPTPLEKVVGALAGQPAASAKEVKEQLGKWFDDAMERVSGAYKRWTQVAALILGLIIAVAANIDTIAIIKSLGNSPQQASQFADSLDKIVKQYPELKQDNQAEIRERLSDAVKAASLPIGWKDGLSWRAVIQAFAHSIMGWLLTALAASLGAAFWFDTLKRFVSIRSSGKNPKEK